MPEKPLTVAAYAAGASLAAVTLVYVFGPTFFLDEGQSSSSRKKGAVGLNNPANDCFINSVLQVLAGLGDLRLYLIREVHRRTLDGPDVYKFRVEEDDGPEEKGEKGKRDPQWKIEGLQKGTVTKALKTVLDQLNERPIYRKTISAQSFISALEQAFRTRISRQQQDAQEFLQVVAERLCEEYHAGHKAREATRRMRQAQVGSSIPTISAVTEKPEQLLEEEASNDDPKAGNDDDVVEEEEEGDDEEQGFPFEGTIESYIECSFCGFTPKPSVSKFVTLTLYVPQKSSTSLSSCFDGIFKTEHIDDFRCDRCRLTHALEVKTSQLARATSDQDRQALRADLDAIKHSLSTDPEKPPKNVTLPPLASAPTRRIARHMRISEFPKILAIHLSRSVYSAAYSSKNMTKVSFPENLPLGSLSAQNRVKYRLLGTVTHRGGHNSGHYESFRRQLSQGMSPHPFSTPASFGTEGVFSRSGSPNPSVVQSPNLSSMDLVERRSALASEITSPAPSISPAPTPSPASGLEDRASGTSLRSPTASSSKLTPPSPALSGNTKAAPARAPNSSGQTKPDVEKSTQSKRLKRKNDNRWWRISDDKVREAKTSDVLATQREIYLLFYDLEKSKLR